MLHACRFILSSDMMHCCRRAAGLQAQSAVALLPALQPQETLRCIYPHKRTLLHVQAFSKGIAGAQGTRTQTVPPTYKPHVLLHAQALNKSFAEAPSARTHSKPPWRQGHACSGILQASQQDDGCCADAKKGGSSGSSGSGSGVSAGRITGIVVGTAVGILAAGVAGQQFSHL